MTHTAFFDVVRQISQAALTGTAPPALGGKLLTHLKIIAKCFAGEEIVTVDEGTAEFLILAKASASGEASLIDSTAVLDESDPDAPQYEFEWNPADSVQLRAVLDAAADPTAPVELRYEFRFERNGEKGCVGGPIWFLNNFFRPETPAPEATLNTSWETLKSRVLAGANITRTVDENAKTMIFAGEDSDSNAAALAAETAARIAADVALQSAVDGKAAASHTHPISDVTNLQSSLDAKLNADDDSVTNARTPTGSAGGVLSGSYPNPGFAVDMATQGELDAVSAQLPAKADLVDGKIPTSQIPAIAISEFLGAVASQAAMLALTGQKGDWCNRSDTSTAWVIIGDDPTQLASWGQINYPAPLVTSVNGQTGVIVLGKSDVGLANVDNTSDANKPVSTAQQAALNGKANTSHTHAQADVSGLVSALAAKAALTQVVRTDSQQTLANSAKLYHAWNAGTLAWLRMPFGAVGAGESDSNYLDDYPVDFLAGFIYISVPRSDKLPSNRAVTINLITNDGSGDEVVASETVQLDADTMTNGQLIASGWNGVVLSKEVTKSIGVSMDFYAGDPFANLTVWIGGVWK